jgi:hypothetical protein
MTTRYPRCSHNRDFRFCDTCSPNETHRARAALFRPLFPANRQELADAAGVSKGTVDKTISWIRENNAYQPASLESPRGGRGARYYVTENSTQRSAYCVTRASTAAGEIRRVVIDTLEPWMRAEGTPEAVVRAIRRTVDSAMTTVEEILTASSAEEQVAEVVVPDDISSLTS